MRVVAADWSGAAHHEQRHLWMAEIDARTGRLTHLAGRTRRQAAERLLELADEDRDLVVGLDFGFSLPSWFLDGEGIVAASELWADESRLEGWLQACRPPFWGKPGRCRPALPPEQHWRRTELATRPRPRSVFQVGGAGSVGTASLRGMPVLDLLRKAGFAIWPFDPPGRPLVMEVWPRLAIGPVVKSRPADRRAWLDQHASGPTIAPDLLAVAAASADAFDAAAAAMALFLRFERDPPATADPIIVREGWIWGIPLPGGDGSILPTGQEARWLGRPPRRPLQAPW